MLEPGPPKGIAITGGGEGGEGGGECVENLVRGDSFKAKAKLNQSKTQSTKHAGRPADLNMCKLCMYIELIYINAYMYLH